MLNHEIWKSRSRKTPKNVKPSKNTKTYVWYSDLSSYYFVEEQHRHVKWNDTVPGTVCHQCAGWAGDGTVDCSGKLELCTCRSVLRCGTRCVSLSELCRVTNALYICNPPPNHWALPIVEEVENGRIRRRMLDINRARAFHLLPAIKHFLCWWWITDWLDTGQMDEDKCFCSFLLFSSHFNQFCRFSSLLPLFKFALNSLLRKDYAHSLFEAL